MLMNRLFQGVGGFQNALTVGPTPAGSRSTPYLGQPLGGMPGQGMGPGQPLQQYGQYLEKTYDNFDGKRNAFLSNVREQEQNTFGQSQRPQNQFTSLESQQPYGRDQFNANNLGQLGDPLEAVKGFNQGGEVPRQTEIMGQPHMLAYINPQEEALIQSQRGGMPALEGPEGVPAFYFGGYEDFTDMVDGGGPGASGDTYSNVDNSSLDENNDGHISHAEAGNQNLAGGIDGSTNDGFLQSVFSPNAGRDDNPDRVGLIDSVMMGIGLTDKTPAYYATTANTIAANQGQGAAQSYLGRLAEDGTISADQFTSFSDSASQVPISEQLQNSGDGDGDGTVDDGTVDDGTVDDGGEDDGPQYTQMKPFYGGYQPSTRADTLVPSQGRGIGSFLPNPRLDPIYPQQPPPDFDYYIDDGPGFPPFDPGFNIDPGPFNPGPGPFNPDPGFNIDPGPVDDKIYIDDGFPPIDPGLGRNFDFGAPANLGDTHYNPELDTTYTYQEKPDGQGGFYSGWDITQGTGPEMVLHGGGGSQGLMNNDMSAQGVGDLFGNEQAPPYMYQGIMG